LLFSSIPFLYYFLPCVLILYLIAPKKLKNAVLLLSSLFFYWWGEPRYVILMVFIFAPAYGVWKKDMKKAECESTRLFLAGALGLEKVL